tara:strand:+ start:31880 stop:32119 length:240 start_codon:yes stop_codon:yes gene_type:complete
MTDRINKVPLSALLVVLYGTMVPLLGFYVSTILYLLSHCLVLGQRDWRVLAIVPPALCFALYLLIERFLLIGMPRGLML